MINCDHNCNHIIFNNEHNFFSFSSFFLFTFTFSLPLSLPLSLSLFLFLPLSLPLFPSLLLLLPNGEALTAGTTPDTAETVKKSLFFFSFFFFFVNPSLFFFLFLIFQILLLCLCSFFPRETELHGIMDDSQLKVAASNYEKNLFNKAESKVRVPFSRTHTFIAENKKSALLPNLR